MGSRVTQRAAPVDPVRAARILGQVLDLAEALPRRTERKPLEYPPLGRRLNRFQD
jgi:hypothetical protein